MEDYLSSYLQYFLPLLTITNGMGLQIRKTPSIDYIIFSATALTVVDSMLSPMIYGKTLHELCGLTYSNSIEQEIVFYEGVATGLANAYMFVRNLSKRVS